MASQSDWRGAELIRRIRTSLFSIRCGSLRAIAVRALGGGSWKRSSPGRGYGMCPPWTWVSRAVIVQRDVFMSVLASSLLVNRNHSGRSEEHTSELQSRLHLVCRLLLEKKKQKA